MHFEHDIRAVLMMNMHCTISPSWFKAVKERYSCNFSLSGDADEAVIFVCEAAVGQRFTSKTFPHKIISVYDLASTKCSKFCGKK
jgi:hypothetical protein